MNIVLDKSLVLNWAQHEETGNKNLRILKGANFLRFP
jgi:hypothetical protein